MRKEAHKDVPNEAHKGIFSHMREYRYLLKPFLVLFLIYLLGISAILLANVHYADDVGRANYGYSAWWSFSRYLTTIGAHFLHADNYLTNIAPLPQILAVGILAAASLLLVCLISGKEIFRERWTKWIWRIIAVVPLGLCPYFLECLSYQYDAPYMALSVLFAIFPFAFRKKSRKLYLAMLVIGVLGACMTYQASVGIFAAVAVLLAIKDWSENKSGDAKESLKFLLWSAGGFLVTLFIFQKFLMVPKDAYVSNDTPGLDTFFPEFFSHLGQYFSLIFSDFKLLWLVLMGLVGLAFVVSFIWRSKRNRFAAGVVALLGIGVMAVVAYAPYAALAKPLYETRAMYAIGAIVAMLGVYVASMPAPAQNKATSASTRCMLIMQAWPKLILIPVLALAWCFFVFSFTYGNALKEQNEYRNLQVSMVAADLNGILPELGAAKKPIQVSGQIAYAPAVRHLPADTFRIVHRLLKSTFDSDVPWMAYQLTEGNMFSELIYDQNIDLTEKNLPVVKDTAMYVIRGDESGVLVEFKCY